VSDVRISTPASADGLRVKGAGVRIENVWIDGPKRGVIAFNSADALRLLKVAVTNTAGEGIVIDVADDVVIEGCIVTGAGSTGIATRKAKRLVLRDSDVYANAASGIFVRKADADLGFLTVHANGGRGVRVLGATVDLHDSVLTNNGGAAVFARGAKPVAVDHVLFWANDAAVNDDVPPVVSNPVLGRIDADPLYVDADGTDNLLGGAGWADDDLSLEQPPEQTATSPAVDAGSGTAADLDVTGSTSSNGAADAGMADLGAHR